MKKSYLISYLGAAITIVIVMSKAKKMVKEYGQPLKQKKKLSLEKLMKPMDKVLNIIIK